MTEATPTLDLPTCNGCTHWKPMDDPAQGYCTRYPPSHDPNDKKAMTWVWPIVGKDDCCGEWRSAATPPPAQLAFDQGAFA